ncbi:MAG: phospho-N-acetylmuramoyl-pentapeptide-transferase [Bacillota bacterium]
MLYFTAVGLPFFILMIFGPLLIRLLKRLNFGQKIRGAGPSSHYKKEGIPTMGGILIILAILITALVVFRQNSYTFWVLLVTIAMGLIGFLDDFKKIVTNSSLGLKARWKILGQLMTGTALAVYVYYYSNIGSGILVPFTDRIYLLDKWILPLVVLTVVGTANAVNLTDGLDGLAAGVTVVVISGLSVISSALGLQELTLFGLSVTGACLGFIWFNSHPAQVFMGDVGSLALGGAVASMAVITRTELFLLIIGGVFVLETLSVIIQVFYFRITGGRRVFKMTPLHHHFELAGLAENKIVIRLLLVSMAFASLGLAGFYYSL